MLLLEPQTAMITFGIQSTPLNTAKFMKRLGLQLNVFQTTLADAEHVYTSKHPPNQTGVVAVSGFAEGDIARPDVLNPGVKTTVIANVDLVTGKISSLTGRLLAEQNIQSSARQVATPETSFTEPEAKKRKGKK
jgi:hypothetical protein